MVHLADLRKREYARRGPVVHRATIPRPTTTNSLLDEILNHILLYSAYCSFSQALVFKYLYHVVIPCSDDSVRSKHIALSMIQGPIARPLLRESAWLTVKLGEFTIHVPRVR